MKKTSFLLALLMLLTLTFAACGGDKSSSSQSSQSQSSQSQTDDGGNDGDGEDRGEPVEIIWMIRADEPINVDSVMAALNAKLLEDINMTLDMRFIAPGDYNDKMQMTFSGGDEWDLCFTAEWANSYVNAVGGGAYLALDDLLAENAPGYMSIFPENMLDGARVNGKLYGLVNYQVMYDQAGYWFHKEEAERLDLVDDINNIKSWADLTEVLRAVEASDSDMYATRGGWGGPLMFMDPPMSLVLNLPFLAFDPETKQISNTLFFDTYEGYESLEIWQKEGLQPADASTIKDENTMIKQEQLFSRYSRQKPGNAADLAITNGFEVLSVEFGPKIVDTKAVQSTITAVNANSKNPEKAIQLYDYFFTNEEAFNMLIYGIEGQDYTKLDGNFIEKLPDTYSVAAWMLGNQFLAYLTPGKDADVWAQTMKGNEEANLDALFGFVPDRTPIETELAVCEAKWNEFKDILGYGLQDTESTINELMVQLEAGGLDVITEELQKQIDAFFASK